MDLKTTLANASDPGKYRAASLTLTLTALGVLAYRYKKERTVWNLLPIVRTAIRTVEVAFAPGKDTETE